MIKGCMGGKLVGGKLYCGSGWKKKPLTSLIKTTHRVQGGLFKRRKRWPASGGKKASGDEGREGVENYE